MTYKLFFFLFIYLISFTNSFSRTDLSEDEKIKVYKAVIPTVNFSKAERSEALSGGAGTVENIGKNAFSHHFTNLTFEQKQNFLVGNGLFRKIWISSPASIKSSDGLGPLYNARACQSCHIKDGRGHLPKGEKFLSSVIKLGAYNGLDLNSHKVYGKQFQFFALPGILSEGNVTIVSKNKLIKERDNITLKYNKLIINKLNYGSLDNNNSTSLRVSPQVIGVGLLESIEQSDILAKEDINDSNKDGVSGIARIIYDKEGNKEIGRFGVRASTPNLFVQTGVAFMHDMGLSNSVASNAFGDCTKYQKECYNFPTGINEGSNLEVEDNILEKIVFYLSSLSPPKRREVSDKNVLAGKEIFYKSKCISCHTPKYVTSKNAKHDFLKFQLIWPYTDLLLHDMGDGLADRNIKGEITNKEWKTPPLWGIGYAKEVNSRATFLHDGRAKNILEAVLWHSGEAKPSIDFLLENYKKDLDKLESFLKSL